MFSSRVVFLDKTLILLIIMCGKSCILHAFTIDCRIDKEFSSILKQKRFNLGTKIDRLSTVVNSLVLKFHKLHPDQILKHEKTKTQ